MTTMLMTLLRSKRPQLLHPCPSEEQLKQRVGQLLGFGGAGQGAVAGRAANRHDHPLAQLLALLDALLDFRAAEEEWILRRNAVFAVVGEVQARKIVCQGCGNYGKALGSEMDLVGNNLTLALSIVIKFPLQPHQKYYITQYEELGFHSLLR